MGGDRLFIKQQFLGQGPIELCEMDYDTEQVEALVAAAEGLLTFAQDEAAPIQIRRKAEAALAPFGGRDG